MRNSIVKLRQCVYCGYKWPMRKKVCSACGADLKKTGEIIMRKTHPIKNVIAEDIASEIFTKNLMKTFEHSIGRTKTPSGVFKFGDPFDVSDEERNRLGKLGFIV